MFSSSSKSNKEEPWVREWANNIINLSLSISNISDVNKELGEIGPFLKNDPTEIKKVYLIRELRKRTSTSPMAGVGLLDLVDFSHQMKLRQLLIKRMSLG